MTKLVDSRLGHVYPQTCPNVDRARVGAGIVHDRRREAVALVTSLCRPPAPLGSDCENPHAILSGAGASRGRGRQWQPAPAPSGPALPGAPGNMLPPAHSAPIADPADPGARSSLPGEAGNMLHAAPSAPTWRREPLPPHCQARRPRPASWGPPSWAASQGTERSCGRPAPGDTHGANADRQPVSPCGIVAGS